MDVRLIRSVDAPTGRGPGNGQYALQKALRTVAPAWLSIGGILQPGEMPWFWCWKDRDWAVDYARNGWPFVLGPNVLFNHSRRPRETEQEQILCDAASCRLLFTESGWYRDLIKANLGPNQKAPIHVWPYPIDPQPEGPLEPWYDLLIYAKSGYTTDLVDWLEAQFERTTLVRYGHYQREQLVDLARHSRACVYLSDDDRGPLALAEILLSGCPTVGVPRGAPFVRPRLNGFLLDPLWGDVPAQVRLKLAIEACHTADRQAVARWARSMFDPQTIAIAVIAHLDDARRDP